MCSMGLPRKMRPCRRSLLKEENELEWQKAMKNDMEQFVEAGTRKVFDGMSERDNVAWNAMISGFELWVIMCTWREVLQ